MIEDTDNYDGLDKFSDLDNFVNRSYDQYLNSWGGQDEQ